MLIVVLFLLGVVIIRLLGGDVHRLKDLRLASPGLAIGALALQVVIISIWPNGWRTVHLLLHFSSYVLLAAFLYLNRHLPWIWLVTLGCATNFAAISANGGVMPASTTALRYAGRSTGKGFANSLAVPHAHLMYLGDILATPSWVPLHNVASIGDIAIVAGAVMFVAATSLARSAEAPSGI